MDADGQRRDQPTGDEPNPDFPRWTAQIGVDEGPPELRRIRARVRSLLLAISAVVSDTEIASLPQTIRTAAAELIDADYAELVLLDPKGMVVSYLGGNDEAPKGGDVLDLLGDPPAPSWRIDDLHGRAGLERFAEPEPGRPMRSLVVVSARGRDGVVGVLSMCRSPQHAAFTIEDEMLARGVMAVAGAAVDTARSFAGGRVRERNLEGLAQIAVGLLSGEEPEDVLPVVVRRVRQIIDADVAAVLLPSADGRVLGVDYADGEIAGDILGLQVPADASVSGTVYRSGESIRIGDFRSDARVSQSVRGRFSYEPAVFVPLGSPGAVRGVVVLANRVGRPMFDRDAVAMLGAFAAQVAASLELSDRRRDLTRMALLEDRDRIARDLHDLVIQRLFAVGMTLDSASRSIVNPDVARRVSRAVDELDATIKEIRTTIFGLQAAPGLEQSSTRARVVAAVDQSVTALGFMPSLRLEGVIDAVVPDRLADQMVAVLREALSNVVRHARASHVDVRLAADAENLELVVEDDGLGIAERDSGRRSGLRNIAERARARGGSLAVEARAPRGTRLRWVVPLPRPATRQGGSERSPQQ